MQLDLREHRHYLLYVETWIGAGKDRTAVWRNQQATGLPWRQLFPATLDNLLSAGEEEQANNSSKTGQAAVWKRWAFLAPVAESSKRHGDKTLLAGLEEWLYRRVNHGIWC